MQTSATGRENNRPPHLPTASNGFTLLEVLVVLVIIGVVIGFAVLSVDTGPAGLHRESTRLASLLELSAEQAVMNGQEYRVILHRHDYAFELRRDGKWQGSDDEMLRPRQLPEGMALEVLLEEQPQPLSDGGSGDAKTPPVALFILSSGEISPFEITLTDSGTTRSTIRSDGNSITSDPTS